MSTRSVSPAIPLPSNLYRHLPDNRVGLTLHFLLHGIHHYLPMDKYRLVMPPTLFVALAAPFWKLAHALIFWNWYSALAAYCGGVFGYTCYDMTHYFLHHQKYVLRVHMLKYTLLTILGCLPTTRSSRSITSSTTLLTTKTDSASQAASGTGCLALSWRWAQPRSSSRPELHITCTDADCERLYIDGH
jgi:hypothetical protein